MGVPFEAVGEVEGVAVEVGGTGVAVAIANSGAIVADAGVDWAAVDVDSAVESFGSITVGKRGVVSGSGQILSNETTGGRSSPPLLPAQIHPSTPPGGT
jgi:hypothetical protein